MANRFYPKGAEKFWRGQINWESDNIAVAIVSVSYTYSDAHEFLSDAGTLVGTKQALANKTFAGGVFDADDADFGLLAPGSTAKALVLFKDTGNASTSPLLCYLDDVVGFPFTTNGGQVTVPWSNGADKIISLV